MSQGSVSILRPSNVMADFNVVLWNCDGLRPSATSTPLKMAFFNKEFVKTKFSLAAFVETHLKADDELPTSIKHHAMHYHIIQTPATINNRYAGILILLHHTFTLDATHILIPGRLLHIKFTHTETTQQYNLSVLYGLQNVQIRKAQITDMVAQLTAHHDPSVHNLLLGDFNFVEFPLDRTAGLSRGDKLYRQPWLGLLSTLHMCDPYRAHFPEKKIYSFTNKSGKSRVIRSYVSTTLLPDVTDQTYLPTPFTNAHKVYSFTLRSKQPKGKGYWKLNTAVLTDPPYTSLVQGTVANLDSMDIVDAKTWWRLFIRCIRSKTIKYCSIKRAHERTIKLAMRSELEHLQAIPSTSITPSQTQRLHTVRERINASELQEIEGYRVRIRGLPTYEHSEPNIQFYAKLERQRGDQNAIAELIDDDGDLHADTPTMLHIVTQYYTSLYTPSPVNHTTQNKLLRNVHTSVSRQDRDALDAPFTLAELQAAVRSLKPGKSPGLDGLPIEFYQRFWPLLQHHYLSYVNAVQASHLDPWKNTSITALLYKNRGDANDLTNYRPISLINVDVKIITKVLTTRLRTVLPSILHHSQTAVDGRRIDNTVHMLRDLIHLANTQNTPACFLFLDQEKAFDRVDHSFLYRTMATFGIGDTFINWIKMLYSNATTKVKINGFLTDPIPLRRGARQGDPLSFYEYLFINEILALQLRNNPNIVGFQIGGEKIVSQHYADDTTISITQNRCFKEVYKELSDYEEATGAKVNYSKSKGLWVGPWTARSDSPLSVSFTNTNVKSLGVYFGNDDPAAATFNEIYPKIKRSLTYWQNLGLSKFAKARVLDIFLASRLWYAATFYPIPPRLRNQLQREFFTYLNHPHKKITVSQAECTKLHVHGGLKLVDIALKATVSKMHWLIRLCSQPSLSTHLALTTSLLGSQPGQVSGLDLFFTPPRYGSYVLRTTSLFHREAIKGMNLLSLRKRVASLASEHIFYNRLFSLPDGKCITPRNLRTNTHFTIAPVMLAVHQRANGLPYSQSLTTLYDKMTFAPLPKNEHHLLVTPTKDYPFHKVTIRLLYQLLLTQNYKDSHYQPKWHAQFGATFNWESIWTLTNNLLTSADTRTLIWEQLHLNHYTQYNFNKWHNKSQPCSLCLHLPTNVFHLTSYCPFTTVVWTDLTPALNLLHPAPVSDEEKVFGLKGHDPPTVLRNWLTFLLRECIATFELRAYHNQLGMANIVPFKHYYNSKLQASIAQLYHSYEHRDRLDTFDRYFCFNDSLVQKEGNGVLNVIYPFQIDDD